MDGWMAGWLDGWMDGWMAGWMDGWIYFQLTLAVDYKTANATQNDNSNEKISMK